MKNPFRNLHQIERDVGAIAFELTHVQFMRVGVSHAWRPAINVFRCGDHFIVCVELAGVERDSIDVRAEPRRVVLRGTRVAPEPACAEPPALQVLTFEIDHGAFERTIDLPVEVDPRRVSAEHRNGLLWIKLPLRAHA